MDNTRKGKIPWAIVLLIVVFTITVAYCGALLFNSLASDDGYDYEIFEINGNKGLEVTDDGFVYYDGSSISSISPPETWQVT